MVMRVCRHERGEIGKRRMEERKPHFVGKTVAAGRDGLRIPVEREHAAFGTERPENECRMTAAPERRIDIITARFQGQSRKRLSGEHRLVPPPVKSAGPGPTT